ncbi:thioredoxin-disulfide reductase [candidate division WWE3 bacterium]|nr:thioredoxin-disulfide reductase [candidate division WWE3 bacterium]
MPNNKNNKKTEANPIYDVAILGGGPAGLTAAIYTSRAQLETLVIAGSPPGGQLMTTTEVENFPGFPEGIDGPTLVQRARDQAERFGTRLVDENVASVSGTFEEGFKVTSEEGNEYHARTVLIATGASARWLGLESEQKMRGKGVSACATCDGFFFKGKEVAVIGGGDSAMEEATFLTRFATKVHVLVRKDREGLRASKIMQERAFKNEKINFHFNTELVEVLGNASVTGIKVLNNQTNEIAEMPQVEGVFIAIGHRPNTAFLEGFVEFDEKGYVKVFERTHTSKEGVFVAGDVADFKYRQAVTAAGLGTMAALDLERFLAAHE